MERLRKNNTAEKLRTCRNLSSVKFHCFTCRIMYANLSTNTRRILGICFRKVKFTQ